MACARPADATSVSSRRPTPRRRLTRACALAVAALAAAALPASAAAAPGSGTGAWVWILVAAIAVAFVFVLLRVRGKSGSRASLTDIADGRQILIARGRRVTEELTALTDVVAEREDEAATRHHERAIEVVSAVRARISRSSGQRTQAKAHQDLDEAEWLIGGLRARLDGFVEPLQHRHGLPATCFFDGTHGLATVEVDLGGIALQRIPVRTCAACAVGLVRGEHPVVGTVQIGGRTVPWPAAPRWCGSYGWATKDLRHLHYDGEPLFGDPDRPAVQRRRQTVAERARGVRSRVAPAPGEGPAVLPEEPELELELDLEPELEAELEPEVDLGPEPAPRVDLLEAYVDQEHEFATVAEPREEPGQGNAFSAMGGDVPPAGESAPGSSTDTRSE